jgi:hypothetical protein
MQIPSRLLFELRRADAGIRLVMLSGTIAMRKGFIPVFL